MMSHQAYVEFTTRYEGGETFNTHNASVPSSFPPAPKTLTVRVPWIVDVKQVFKIHEAVSAAKGGTGRKVLRLDDKFGGDEVTYVQDCMHEELEHASENGYWQRSASNTHYVPTIRGAYFMTWKQLAPIKQVRAYFARLRTQRMLRELGVG
jgi:hypothetical protein